MGWTVEDLKKDYSKIKAICDSEGNPDRKLKLKYALLSISQYIKYIDEESNANYIYDKGEDDIDVLLSSIDKYKDYFGVVQNHYDLLNNSLFDYDSTYYAKNYNTDIKEKEMYGLIHDMFKSCGKRVFNYYITMEKNRKSLLNINKNLPSTSGVIFPVPIVKKNYIEVGMKPKMIKDTLVTLTHEYGHSIGALMNDDRYHLGDIFTELESYFFELVGLDYYYQRTNDEHYKCYLEHLININYLRAKRVIDLKKACDNIDKDSSYKEQKNTCINNLKKIGYNFDKSSVNLEINITYLYSYLCAVELFEIYREDKELAIDIFERIIKRDKGVSEYDSINNNITLNKNMIKHIRRIKHVK